MPLLAPAAKEKRLQSEHYVEGLCTTFNDPYMLWEYDGVKYYEKIDANALQGADMSDVIFQYNHSGRVLARQSNKTLLIEPQTRGLFIAADLSKSSAAREMYEDISAELITRMSWAFTVREDSYDRATRTRTILKIKKVYDVSAVSIPANPSTDISARSWIDGVIEAEQRESLERKRKALILKLKLEDII
ncbi:MAG: HK97 family phage prohead protease [Eubacteriales bacterium]